MDAETQSTPSFPGWTYWPDRIEASVESSRLPAAREALEHHHVEAAVDAETGYWTGRAFRPRDRLRPGQAARAAVWRRRWRPAVQGHLGMERRSLDAGRGHRTI